MSGDDGLKIEDSLILDQVLGSDHCPIALKISKSEANNERAFNKMVI